MSEHRPETPADPRNSPLVDDEARNDEYEPEHMEAFLAQRHMDTLINARIHAASIAVQIPFNATEPIDDARIVQRLNTVYDWITAVEEDKPSVD